VQKNQKKIGIIDCEFGNIASLVNAIKYLDFQCEILNKPEKLCELTHLILPGVGSFNEAAKKLRNHGWNKAINEFVKQAKPFLGICLGMQLMFEQGSESGNEEGLGLFEGQCDQFSKKLNITIPHVGFNHVNYPSQKSIIWDGISNNSPFYFIHSYRILSNNYSDTNRSIVSKTIYGEEFISFIEKNKIFGAQFHPEKSHKVGLKLLKNFIEII
jgi:glutamine amidotransferase